MLLHPPRILISRDAEVIFLHTELVESPVGTCYVIGTIQLLGKELEVVWPVSILDHMVYIGEL